MVIINWWHSPIFMITQGERLIQKIPILDEGIYIWFLNLSSLHGMGRSMIQGLGVWEQQILRLLRGHWVISSINTKWNVSQLKTEVQRRVTQRTLQSLHNISRIGVFRYGRVEDNGSATVIKFQLVQLNVPRRTKSKNSLSFLGFGRFLLRFITICLR